MIEFLPRISNEFEFIDHRIKRKIFRELCIDKKFACVPRNKLFLPWSYSAYTTRSIIFTYHRSSFRRERYPIAFTQKINEFEFIDYWIRIKNYRE